MTRAGGVVKNAGESGRKSKPLEHRKEVRVRHSIVGLLLVKKRQGAIDLVFSRMCENRLDRHSHVWSGPAAHETRLIRVEEPWQYCRQSVSQNSGENLGITVGQSDRSPVAKFRVLPARLWKERQCRSRPRHWWGVSL